MKKPKGTGPPDASATLAEKVAGWKPYERPLTIWGIFAVIFAAAITAAMALAALIMSLSSGHQVESNRVEIGSVTTNSNKLDYKNSWERWNQPLDIRSTTIYVGVKRLVRFSKPFQNSPKVLSALSLIDIKPLDVVLSQLGYDPRDATEQDHLREFHVLTFVTSITPEQRWRCRSDT